MKLTHHQILEAFTQEIATLVPKLLASRRRQMKIISEDILRIRLEYDETDANFLVEVFPMRIGRLIESDIKRLKTLKFMQRLKDNPDIASQLTHFDLDTVKSVPIESLYDFEKPKISAKRIHTKCPLHDEKTGSFVVYRDTNSFYCFSCRAGGSNIDLVMKLYNLTFLDAVKWILNTR